MLVTQKLTRLTIFWLSLFIGLVFYFGLNIPVADAAPTLQINYQGKLTDLGDDPVPDGLYKMEFSLCDALENGTCIWTESRTSTKVQVTNGLFSVMLGQLSPLESLDFNQALYLEVKVGTSSLETLSPRKIIGSVPSAFESQRLSGLASSSFLRSDTTNTSALFTAASSTNFFASILNAVSAWFTNLFFGNATGTNLTVGTLAATSSATLASTTITGQLTLGSLNGLLSAANGIVATISTSSLGLMVSGTDYWVNTTGDTMTGALVVNDNITAGSNGHINVVSSTLGYWLGGQKFIYAPAGTENLAVGLNALSSNESGSWNTAVGSQALHLNQTGSDNTALGYDALSNNIIGTFNVAVGESALSSNGSGSENIAIGAFALYFNQTGNSNTALGNTAGQILVGGDNNVFLGYLSGSNISSGTNNIMIGYNTGAPTTTPSNFLNIGNTIYGDLASGNVGIGTTTPNESLVVSGNINISVGSAYKYNGVNLAYGSTTLNNYFFGNAGNFTMTGNLNTAIGRAALLSNTTGQYNTAIGAQALKDNSEGTGNTAIGMDSLFFNTTGTSNTAIGSFALMDNITGSYNTAIGNNALGSNTTGNGNVAIGTVAIFNNTTGNYNTALGYLANVSTGTLTNATAIGYNALVATSNAMVLGNGSIKVGIGVSAPSTALEVLGTVSSTGLQINGIATVSNYVNVASASLGYWLGGQKFISVPSGNNTAIGLGALSANTTGTDNTAVGRYALQSNTSGFYDTAVGVEALKNNINGDRNTAVGVYALRANTSGFQNTANGFLALSSNVDGGYNTAIGTFALWQHAGGYYNIALGTNAGQALTSGHYNTFLGESAGYALVSGERNILIGYNADAPGTSYSDFLNIGNTIYGNLSSDYVGIGVTAPSVALEVAGTVSSTALHIDNFTGLLYATGGSVGTTTFSALGVTSSQWVTTGSDIYYSIGKVGIGVTSPSTKLEVAGTVSSTGLQVNGIATVSNYINVASTSLGYWLGGQKFIHVPSDWNLGIGPDALISNTGGTANLAIGTNALKLNQGGADNLAFGVNALGANTSGNHNVAVGVNSLYSNTAGQFNIALGTEALYSNTTFNGMSNIAIGHQSLRTNYNGSSNIALGTYSLISNYEGSGNVAIGSSALSADVSGSFSVAIGLSTLDASLGNYNVGIGASAGTNLVSGNGNTFLGYYTGNSVVTGTNNIFIGYIVDATSSVSNNFLNIGNTIYGNLSSDYVGIGIAAPTVALEVAGTVSSTGLQVNGVATVSNYVNVASSSLGYWLGGQKFISIPGDNNIAIGIGALASNTGLYNVAVGYQALYANTSGYLNAASGYQALNSNTNGYSNTANGAYALQSNVSGHNNTADGYQALNYNTGSNNTANGANALMNNVGNNNTAVGVAALFGNSNGSGNVALGYYAGSHEAGSNAFYVDNRDRTDTAGDKAGALLYGIFATSSFDQILVVNASTTIAQNLSVLGTGTSYFAGIISSTGLTVANATATFLTVGSLNGLLYATNGLVGTTSWDSLGVTSSQWITSGSDIYYAAGKVGIGTAAPLHPLHVVNVAGVAGFFDMFSGDSTSTINYPAMTSRVARGTPGAPLALQADDLLAALGAQGYNGSAYSTGGHRAYIALFTAENWTTSSNGTYISWATTPIGTTTRTERMRITDAGYVGIGVTAPSAKLEVAGTISSTQYNLSGRTGIEIQSPTTTWAFKYKDGLPITGTNTGMLFSIDAGQMQVKISDLVMLGIGTNSADIYASQLTLDTRDFGSANIGINADSDLLNLNNGYLNVNGTVIANNGGAYYARLGDDASTYAGYFAFPSSDIYLGAVIAGQNYSLYSNGDAYFGANATTTGQFYAGTLKINDLNGLLFATNGVVATITTSSLGIASGQWVTNGSDIYYTTGNVGIGTTTPLQRLDLVDSAGAGALRVGSTTSAYSGSIRYDSGASDFQGYDGSAWRSLTALATVSKERTGFPNRTDTSISFATSTRDFTIAGTNFKVYSSGREIVKSTGSITIPNTTGLYYVYYTSAGVLSTSTAAWVIASDNIPVATIYWNSTTQSGELGDERHGLTMDGETHEYLHKTVGTRFESGFGLTIDNNRATTTSGVIWDEDIDFNIAQQTQFQVFFRNSSNFQFSGAQNAYYLTQGGTLLYDNAGVTTTVPNNNYVNYWFFATNDNSANGTPVISLMGQSAGTLAAAQAENYQNLSLANLPFAEMKILYRVTMRNAGGVPTWIQTTDLRSVSNLPSGTYIASAHSGLTGLDYASAGHTGFAGLSVDNTFAGVNLFTGTSTLATTTISQLTVSGSSTFSNISPAANLTYSLGSASLQWANLYVATGTMAYLSVTTASTTNLIAVSSTISSLNFSNATGTNLNLTGNLYNSAGDLSINDNLAVSGTVSSTALQINGNATTTGRLYVQGTSTMIGKVSIGTTTASDNLTVLGGATFLPKSPVRVGGVNLGVVTISAIYTSDRYAYLGTFSGIASAFDDFQIYDISDPANPTKISGIDLYNNQNSVDAIVVSGKYAYVMSQNATGTAAGQELMIFDVSDPAKIVPVSGVDLANNALSQPFNSLYVSGKYLYITGRFLPEDFLIYDISDPYNPTKVKGIDTGCTVGTVNTVYVQGRFAYLGLSDCAANGSFQIYDISDPANAYKVSGAITNGNNTRSLYVTGRYAYLGTNSSTKQFQIYDISSSTNPLYKSGVQLDANYIPNVVVSGRYAYVTNQTRFTIIDISSSTNPATYSTSSYTSSALNTVGVFSGRYYLHGGADNSGSEDFIIYDVGGQDMSTANIGNIWSNSLRISDNAVFNNNIYVQNALNVGAGGIMTDGNLSVNGTTSVSYFAGSVGIGTVSPSTKLEVVGTISTTALRIDNLTGLLYATNGSVGTTSWANLGVTSSQWITSGSDIYYTGGNVGVGVTAPSTALEVAGTVSSTGLQVNGNATTTGAYHFGSETEYINVGLEPYRVSAGLGNIPWLSGRSLNGAGGINVFGMDTGLFIRETGDGTFPEPTIAFLDNGDIEASRIYANTDDDSMMFSNAGGGYIFDGDITAGNASVDGLSIGGAAVHYIGLNITSDVNYLPTDSNDAYGMNLAPQIYSAAGYNGYGAMINPSFGLADGGNYPLLANLYVDGASVGGGGTGAHIEDYYGLYVDLPYPAGNTFATNTIGAYIGGNVGIKVLRPTVALDVAGTVSSTGLIVKGNATVTSLTLDNLTGLLYASDGIVSTITTSSLGMGSLPSGTDGQTLYYSGTAWTATSTLTVATSTGKVGIGTTSPAEALDVYGNIQISTNNFLKYNGSVLAYASTTKYNYFFGGAGTSTTAGLALETGTYNVGMGYEALKTLTAGTHNTAIGAQALYTNAINNDNTAIGYQALYKNAGATAEDNTAIGSLALYNNTGGNNTAIGSQALEANTTGFENFAAGYQSLHSNTIGFENTAGGVYSLFTNTEGHENTAFGIYSLNKNLTGDHNTAFGHDALYTNSTGSGNVALGYMAGRYETGSNTFYLDNQDRTNTAGDKAKALLYGIFAATAADQRLTINASTTISQSLTVLGTSTFSQRLYVLGTSTMYDIIPGGTMNGNVSNYSLGASTTRWNNAWINNLYFGSSTWKLSQDTAGQLNISNLSGSGAISFSSTSNINVKSSNIALGEQAYPDSLTLSSAGTDNIAIGYQSLKGMDGNWGSVAIGSYALASNTGAINTAVGYGSLQSNTANGWLTALGAYALNKNAGVANTAVGTFALQYNTNGQYNTAVGQNAGVDGTGNNNKSWIDNNMLFLGAWASRDGSLVATSSALTNGIAIGYNAKVGASSTMALGGMGTDAVRVVIGAAITSAVLEVHKDNPAADESMLLITRDSGNLFRFSASGTAYATGGFQDTGADYAEYYYTKDTDLSPGEAVCVDVTKNNSVVKCSRAGDDNIMGIVSTKPAIVGNSKESYRNNPNYKIVAMLGQIPAKASAENGEIRPGDYLTAASVPGYIMKAGTGDATVGVALEGLNAGEGTINVMISRRNKSMTVEQVEEAVTKRIADMELEDEVNIMLADTIKNYDFTDDISSYLNPFMASVDAKLTLLTDTFGLKVEELVSTTLGADANMANQILAANNLISLLNEQVSTTASNLSVTNEKIEGLDSLVLANNDRLATLELFTSSSITDLQSAIANLSLQPATSSVSLVSTFDSLAVNGDSQFNGMIKVVGDAEFAGKVTVRGQVAYGGDTVGQAKILSSANPNATTTVHITFEQAYGNLPIITVTPIDYDGKWKLSHVATTGFDIIADPIPDNDIVFNWHAFGSLSETKLFVSDGSRELINAAATDKIIEVPPVEEILPETAPIDEPATTTPETPVTPIVETSPEPEIAPVPAEPEAPAAPLEEQAPVETISQPEQTPVAEPVSIIEPVQ